MPAPSLYTPEPFRESDETALFQIMDRYPFAALVTTSADGISVSHVPIIAARARRKLHGHVARASRHWREFDGRDAIAIFRGPDSYISPAWYESKPMVPTWNYAAVHVSGPISAITDQARISAILGDTIARFEAGRPERWQLADLPADYAAGLALGIVGFEIEIASLEGKFKLSQNLAPDDRRGAIAGLMKEHKDECSALAALMAQAGRHDIPEPADHS